MVEKEARYHKDSGKRRYERPGDIIIKNWKFKNDEIGNLYLDVSVGNLFAASYVNQAAAKRLWLAEEIEKRKKKKYLDKDGNERDDIIGLGLEVLGGMSQQFKGILQRIAEAMEMRTEIVQSIWMNKLRSTIMMELMYWNTKMVQKSYNLYCGDDILANRMFEDDI